MKETDTELLLKLFSTIKSREGNACIDVVMISLNIIKAGLSLHNQVQKGEISEQEAVTRLELFTQILR